MLPGSPVVVSPTAGGGTQELAPDFVGSDGGRAGVAPRSVVASAVPRPDHAVELGSGDSRDAG